MWNIYSESAQDVARAYVIMYIVYIYTPSASLTRTELDQREIMAALVEIELRPEFTPLQSRIEIDETAN